MACNSTGHPQVPTSVSEDGHTNNHFQAYQQVEGRHRDVFKIYQKKDAFEIFGVPPEGEKKTQNQLSCAKRESYSYAGLSIYACHMSQTSNGGLSKIVGEARNARRA
jgi:hypothetical protein